MLVCFTFICVFYAYQLIILAQFFTTCQLATFWHDISFYVNLYAKLLWVIISLVSLHWFFFYLKLLISNLSNMCTLIVNEVVSHSTKIVVGGLMVWKIWQTNKQPSIIEVLIITFVLPNFHHILTWKIWFQLLQRISWKKFQTY
jgi:hypothetical protein